MDQFMTIVTSDIDVFSLIKVFGLLFYSPLYCPTVILKMQVRVWETPCSCNNFRNLAVTLQSSDSTSYPVSFEINTIDLYNTLDPYATSSPYMTKIPARLCHSGSCYELQLAFASTLSWSSAQRPRLNRCVSVPFKYRFGLFAFAYLPPMVLLVSIQRAGHHAQIQTSFEGGIHYRNHYAPESLMFFSIQSLTVDKTFEIYGRLFQSFHCFRILQCFSLKLTIGQQVLC